MKTRAYNKDGSPVTLFGLPVFHTDEKPVSLLENPILIGGCEKCGWTGVKDIVLGEGNKLNYIDCECMQVAIKRENLFDKSCRDEIGEPVKPEQEVKKINFREFL